MTKDEQLKIIEACNSVLALIDKLDITYGTSAAEVLTVLSTPNPLPLSSNKTEEH